MGQHRTDVAMHIRFRPVLLNVIAFTTKLPLTYVLLSFRNDAINATKILNSSSFNMRCLRDIQTYKIKHT